MVEKELTTGYQSAKTSETFHSERLRIMAGTSTLEGQGVIRFGTVEL